MLSEEKRKEESKKEKTKKQDVQKFLVNMANNISAAYQARENEYFNLQLTIQDNVKYSNSVTKKFDETAYRSTNRDFKNISQNSRSIQRNM